MAGFYSGLWQLTNMTPECIIRLPDLSKSVHWGPFESGNAVYMGSGIGKKLEDFEASAKVKWGDGQYNSVGFSVGDGYYWGDVLLRYMAKYPADPVIRLRLHNWGGTSEVFMPAPPRRAHLKTQTRRYAGVRLC